MCMVAIRISKKDQNTLRKLGVVTLYVFGSRAQGMAGPLSDYDFAVLTKGLDEKRGGETYLAIYDLLSDYCPRTLKNDVIDIVFLQDAPLELRFHVIRYGKVLVDADPRARLCFEEKTTLEYCDFRPILDMVDQAILASI